MYTLCSRHALKRWRLSFCPCQPLQGAHTAQVCDNWAFRRHGARARCARAYSFGRIEKIDLLSKWYWHHQRVKRGEEGMEKFRFKDLLIKSFPYIVLSVTCLAGFLSLDKGREGRKPARNGALHHLFGIWAPWNFQMGFQSINYRRFHILNGI